MSVATLCARRESSTPPNYKGRSWVVRVNGLIYSKKEALKKEYPIFIEHDGELVLGLRPDIDEALKETLENKPLPIKLVTGMLKSMAQIGCKEVTSTSGAASDEEIWFIWTFMLGFKENSHYKHSLVRGTLLVWKVIVTSIETRG